MGVTALVMAGGRGARMSIGEEKPLLMVGGRPMIEHIVSALRHSKTVDGIVVAVSKYTPETEKLSRGLPVRVIQTPGKGYVPDMQYAIRNLKLGTVLVISADVPLVTSEIVDKILERHTLCRKPALTVAVPGETRERLGLERNYAIKTGAKYLVPAGINVINGTEIDKGELEEEILIIDDDGIAMNVNTPHDLAMAENLFMKRSSGGTKYSTRC